MQDPEGKQNEARMRLKELGETETIRQMIAPTFAPGGETGLFLLGIVISIAFVFASRPASGLSVIIAAEIIAMAVPGCVLAVVLCGRFFSRLNFVVSVLLVFFAVNAVVISAHLAQLYWLGGLDNPMELLLRRMFFTTVLVAFLMRLSTMSHRLRLRKAAEQTAKIQALQSRIRPHFYSIA